MEQKLKQQICIEFCVKLQISATETFEMLNKAFPNDAPKRTTVFEWHSRFKAGRISIEDDPRQGRPKFQRTDENVQQITDLIKENPRTTLLELEQDTDISKTTIGKIVTEDLKLKKTPAKFIPRFLTNEQKLCRLATCEDMLEMTRTDPEWKDKIITGDETWVYGYDPETKRQSAEWRGQDIAPNDFFLFPKLKAVLKGRHFDTRWYREFPRGKYGKRDALRSGRPASSLNEEIIIVKILLEANEHITYHQIEEGLDIPAQLIHSILHGHLIVNKVCFPWVPYSSTDEQMTRPNSWCREMLKKFDNESSCFVNSIMTVAQVIKRLRPNSRTDTWIFHHDNAPAHRSKVCADYLARTGLKLLEHPPYSPDLVPCYFVLFPHVKNRLKGKRFFCDEDLLRTWDDECSLRKQRASQRNVEKHGRNVQFDPHWLKYVNTGDQTWVYGYDPETKRQSSQWLEPGEPRLKKARVIKSKLKCLLITLFDVKELVHYEFVPEVQAINQHYYLDVLRRLREAVRQKRPEK
ncbi:hypothetical protein LAZ67_21001768 [Cordylochernes scorpioides]|uniref:Mos1 transposase HTH domain-containing protein n=1 Tax=Cordylochernes scorpioides TaxID=51811 RepID=A0ABY6LPX6_9ARAC|nr:hypothetical protein LAZ67_21001768 [Cordylochernes scorpioides]